MKILNSDYDTSGSVFQMSTSYKLMMQTDEQFVDIEYQNRFFKQRKISEDNQS